MNSAEIIPTHLKARIEAWLVGGMLWFFSLLPLDAASWLGGALMRLIGVRLRRHQTVLDNLKRALPHLTVAERERIARAMWEHLGRIFAEFPFVRNGSIFKRIKHVEGLEHFRIEEQCIYISGHFGQWEMLNGFAKMHQQKFAAVYRHMNNPLVDALLKEIRAPYADILIRKSGSAISMVRALSQGLSLAMLVDQHLTQGDVLDFFGHPAKTNTTAAKLALARSLPVVALFVTRTRGAHFAVEIFPLHPGGTTENISGTQEAMEIAVRGIMQQFHKMFEARIRERPEQWLWAHKRWRV